MPDFPQQPSVGVPAWQALLVSNPNNPLSTTAQAQQFETGWQQAHQEAMAPLVAEMQRQTVEEAKQKLASLKAEQARQEAAGKIDQYDKQIKLALIRSHANLQSDPNHPANQALAQPQPPDPSQVPPPDPSQAQAPDQSQQPVVTEGAASPGLNPGLGLWSSRAAAPPKLSLPPAPPAPPAPKIALPLTPQASVAPKLALPTAPQASPAPDEIAVPDSGIPGLGALTASQIAALDKYQESQKPENQTHPLSALLAQLWGDQGVDAEAGTPIRQADQSEVNSLVSGLAKANATKGKGDNTPHLIPGMVTADGKPAVMTTKQLQDLATGGDGGNGTPPAFTPKVGATLQTRVGASMVSQDAEDAIRQSLSDPKVIAALGPISGRMTKISQWWGNPPPELQGLKGELEGFFLNTAGVHGMRNAVIAQHMYDENGQPKMEPEALLAAIHGLNVVPRAFVQHWGAGMPNPGPAKLALPLAASAGQTPTSGSQLSLDQAKQLLQQFGGDKAKARAYAQSQGYVF
jgi:hypothetical protein